MARESDGDHIDLRNAEVGRDLIGKVEHHYHHSVPAKTPPPGTPLGDLSPADAHTFEVHEVADPTGRDDLPPLPPYLYRRDVDDPLRAAVRDARNASGLVLLVGGSSVGKTRACWEAVHAELPSHWRLWHPLSPTRSEALMEALRADQVAPHTVVWLNEAQLYLRDPQVLEALQGLIADSTRGPTLVLGSLWPDYWRELLDETSSGRESRLLLDRARDITVPDSFTSTELRGNTGLSHTDPRLVWALREGDRGQVTQALSGSLDLLRRYRHGTPAERAVLEVAMDTSRIHGFTYSLPLVFLQEAAPGYLSPAERAQLSENWFTTVVESLARRGQGTPGPLIPASVGEQWTRCLLPDYLEEYGRERRRHLCPPDSFWEAAAGFSGATVVDLPEFAQAAEDRLLLRHVDSLLHDGTTRFLIDGPGEVLTWRARLRTRAGDYATAERLATDAARAGRPDALLELVDTADRPELTRAAFALLHRTTGTDRLIEEATSRFHSASEEGKRLLARVLDENTGPEGLWAVIELLRPIRDRTGIRLCLERIDPEWAKAADAEQAAWETALDRRIERAVEQAVAGDFAPLRTLLSKYSHPLHTTLRGEIARRCVAAGVHQSILKRTVPFLSPASPEFLEALAESGDPEELLLIAEQSERNGHSDTHPHFLRLAIEATPNWSVTTHRAFTSLLRLGERGLVERLLGSFDDVDAAKLTLRLCLSRGDVEEAERMVFLDGATNTFGFGTSYVYQRLQRVLIRHLRRRGDTTAAERLARRSVGREQYSPLASLDLAELLTERGRRAEAIACLTTNLSEPVALEEIAGCLLTEPVAAEAAARMRRPEAAKWNGPLLSLLAWAAKAAGDDERAKDLHPRQDALVDDDLVDYLSKFVLPNPGLSWNESKYVRREFRAMIRHLRHGTPLTLARHLAARVETLPGLARRERWAADNPTEAHPGPTIWRARERYEGRQHLGVLLAWTSHLYRFRGDRASAEELEDLSLRISGSGAVPVLVRIHLDIGDHDRIRALLGCLGEEITLASDASRRSQPSVGDEETLRDSLNRNYHLDTATHAQRTLVHLTRAEALHLADDIIGSLTSEIPTGIRHILDQTSPVGPLLTSARIDLALVASRWLRGHRCLVDLSSYAEEWEFEGDWDNAALLYALSMDRDAELERLATVRAAAGAGGAPNAWASVERWNVHVRLAEEQGDHLDAERIALRATAAGRGVVLEDLARRRISRGEDVHHWRTVLQRGLTPDGNPDPDWCETTDARGDLRPTIMKRTGVDHVPPEQTDDSSGHIPAYAPYTGSVFHLFLPMALFLFAPAGAEALVLTTTVVSFSVTLLLLPWLTADSQRRWPLRAGRLPLLLASAAIWGPAMIGVNAATVVEQSSPARILVTVVTAPLSPTSALGFALFSSWLGTLGGAVMSLALVYAFLALNYQIRWRRHRLYLATLRSEA